MSAHKRFRQGQILKLLAGESVGSQDDLRRQLIHLGVRVTQATLSRDLRELRLVKTAAGYNLSRPPRLKILRGCAGLLALSRNFCWIYGPRRTCWC